MCSVCIAVCLLCVCTSVKYTNYISRPFSASVSPSNPPHPSCQKIGPHNASPMSARSGVTGFLFLPPPLLPSSSLHLLFSSLFVLFVCPSPVFLLFSNKNNRLWNTFSCGITHRHQPPHAIRLSRGRGELDGGGGGGGGT